MLPNIRRFVMWHTFSDENKQNDGAEKTHTTKRAISKRYIQCAILSHHSHTRTRTHSHPHWFRPYVLFVCSFVRSLFLVIWTPQSYHTIILCHISNNNGFGGSFCVRNFVFKLNQVRLNCGHLFISPSLPNGCALVVAFVVKILFSSHFDSVICVRLCLVTTKTRTSKGKWKKKKARDMRKREA